MRRTFVSAATIAAACILLPIGSARADEVSDLKAEAKALAKQNEQLNKRLADIEKRQKVLDARAADLSMMPVKAVKAPPVVDDALCWHGVCLYGVVDAGFGWEAHGMPFNSSFTPADSYLVTKGSNRAMFEASPNGLSQSAIGLKGSTELLPGLNGIFKVDTGFNPMSGQLANSQASFLQNNFIPLPVQTANGDSSRNGQAFNGQAWVGLQSPTYGTLTVGRNNSLTLDQMLAYDPMGGSYAFSPLGFNGDFGGAGSTETGRLDQSIKYTVAYGPVHGGVIYQVGNYGNSGNSSWVHDALQGDLGFSYMGFSVDGTVSQIHGLMRVAAPLTGTGACGAVAGTLCATAADTLTWMVTAKYKWDRFEIMGGYEHIDFSDPRDPISNGITNAFGYTVSSVSNTAYLNGDKIFQMMWIGGKVQATEHVNLALAYYHMTQNAFDGSTCSNTSDKTCSGNLDAVSFVADYVFTKHFDVYAGVMWSQITGGLANGAVQTGTFNAAGTVWTANGRNTAWNVDPMVGARYSF